MQCAGRCEWQTAPALRSLDQVERQPFGVIDWGNGQPTDEPDRIGLSQETLNQHEAFGNHRRADILDGHSGGQRHVPKGVDLYHLGGFGSKEPPE